MSSGTEDQAAAGRAYDGELMPIRVTGDLRIRDGHVVYQGAADYGAYFSLLTPAAGQGASGPLLPYDEKRKVAYVVAVATTAAFAAVLLGSQAQAQASPALGFPVTCGPAAGQPSAVYTITHKQAVWYVNASGVAVMLAWAVERWE